ncbi:MAG: ABC transporter ATP-binding protein [Verrucomicrobia bacterium]|nr:ABC transporter ATP-binding protein [Verrucomicrobiota bacterium]
MKFLFLFFLWCVLFVLSWPIALLALIIFPLVWLICLPFRLVGITVHAVFAFVKALLLLPARLLGYRPCKHTPAQIEAAR